MIGLDPIPPSRLVPAIPRDLEIICLKCLRKEPATRYGTAGALATDLRRWLAGQPIEARPISTLGRVALWTKRNPWLSAISGAMVLSLLAGAVISTFFGFKAQVRAREAELALQDSRTAQAQTDLLAAELLLNVGQREATAGDVAGGLYTFIEALRRAPPDAEELRRVIRRNFAGWAERLPTLVHYERLDAPASGCRFLGPAGDRFWVRIGDRLEVRSAATGDRLADAHVLSLPVDAVSDDGTRGLLRKDYSATVVDMATGRPVGPEFNIRHDPNASPSPHHWTFGPGNATIAVHMLEWNQPPCVVRVWDVNRQAATSAIRPTWAIPIISRARDGRMILFLFRELAPHTRVGRPGGNRIASAGLTR